jgi:putative addiction module component (TIGR02574 family)
MGQPAFDYLSLSIEERLQLVGDIWDSIADAANASPDVLPLTEEQRAELDRRIAEADAHPEDLIPMEEVMARLRTKIQRVKKGPDRE